ncbi:hypothetical protein DEA8626_03180 [Defluviimonas aquaemixtae]|uniref:Swt1-like HEPN domain-containing protein n=1 Tax=Albidovulum aquaemixtae TaxID=1542388 RepID=A0A2R8BLC2_9RHOB|nr:hypothetical protein [Defluviimonas aquaemixtae]SPH24131.1 hypothetical protein DEA8626_03180 [Defluviimonas aquaemixtae]
MLLNTLTQDDLRALCRRSIEGLELWLRRLIDYQLSAAYGNNYLEAKRDDGSNVINNEVKNKLVTRLNSDPSRYPRPIDAATLEEEIRIICNPDLYRKYFREALGTVFPHGHSEVRTFLSRISSVRNPLSHATPISVRQAEQVLCYTNDIVDGLKAFYRGLGMRNEYNAPMIIRISDSFGGTFHADQISRNNTGGGRVDRTNDPNAVLRPGDTLSIEVEVDQSFDPATYEISWPGPKGVSKIDNGLKALIQIDESHVSTALSVECTVTSNKSWHRRGMNDDQVFMIYKVLPPVE